MKNRDNEHAVAHGTPFGIFTQRMRWITMLASIALCGTINTPAAVFVTPVDWSTETSGFIGGVGVSLSSISIPFPGLVRDFDTSGADFAFAPLPPTTEFVQYGVESDWTATFTQPVEGLLLYVGFWRGNYTTYSIDPPTPYTFNRPFTIVSGLERVVRTGNTLTFPDDSPLGDPPGFHSGIIQFPGWISSVTVQNGLGSPYLGGQLMTFAVPVPEPSASVLFILATAWIPLAKACKIRHSS